MKAVIYARYSFGTADRKLNRGAAPRVQGVRRAA